MTDSEQIMTALERVADAIFDRWKIDEPQFREIVKLSRQGCLRLIEIYENLHTLFGDADIEAAWLRQVNYTEFWEEGSAVSPLTYMMYRCKHPTFTPSAASAWQRMGRVLTRLEHLNGRT